MNRTLVFGVAWLLIGALAAVCGADDQSSEQAGDGWVALFDGTSLNGWVQKNGTATYRVEDGAIVGRTSEGSPNSFLCTVKEYGDFELEFEVKVDDRLNSGVQIRSKTKETATGRGRNNAVGRVYGPQVEIEASGRNGGEAGYIYGEATGRGWLTPDERRKPHKHFKDGQWNHFRVVAKGPRIQTWINGVPIEDLTDEEIYKTHPRGVHRAASARRAEGSRAVRGAMAQHPHSRVAGGITLMADRVSWSLPRAQRTSCSAGSPVAHRRAPSQWGDVAPIFPEKAFQWPIKTGTLGGTNRC